MEEVIFSYTRQDAINDGVFVDVSEVAKRNGFDKPVALTTNLYHTLITRGLTKDGVDYERALGVRLDAFLSKMWKKVEKEIKYKNGLPKEHDSLMYFQIPKNEFDRESDHVDVWIAEEAQGPYDPTLAYNIMLPEDY